VVGKGCRRVNTMQILCTHVCKCKNYVETIPGMWGEEEKRHALEGVNSSMIC
jgi:hypothetical protein